MNGTLNRIALGLVVLTLAACQSTPREEESADRAMEPAANTGPGCIQGDCQNGTGIYVYESGDRYSGEFKDGLRHGRGTFEYANGDRYVGNYENGQRSGQGVYTFANGDRYQGEWQNGLREGQGVYTFAIGGVYDGQFQNDGAGGQGRYTLEERTRACQLDDKSIFCTPGSAEESMMQDTGS
ncbi:MAG: hypothetical protein H7A21_05580 [Spirochaetales bacterium]|nr:hypothetical protein [Leptospiraceae bacterium]MCP5480886.1 hypothetical protein [Spirochaetales bacterium]